jgi:Stress responsive A/B Barrel Domain
MKKITLHFLSFVILIIMSVSVSSAQSNSSSSKLLRHVVLFKFKDNAPTADVKKVEDAFRALAPKIKLIKDFEWGTNNSPENLNQGLTHCFLVTFSSEKDRDTYLTHPDHVAFVEVLKPHLDKATVLDYWAGK